MLGFRLYADHIGDYMRRWILQTPWGSLRLHKILRSDDDRHLHDHPWDFASLVLGPGYVELGPCRHGPAFSSNHRCRFYPRVFSRWGVNRKRAENAHAVVLPWGPVWTLVWTGRERRAWGFHTEAGWVDRREYVPKRLAAAIDWLEGDDGHDD